MIKSSIFFMHTIDFLKVTNQKVFVGRNVVLQLSGDRDEIA